MGHNTKTMNRNQAILDTRGHVRKVAKTVEQLAETLLEEDKVRVKRFVTLENRAADLEERIKRAEAVIGFMLLSFWKRWYYRFNSWRATRKENTHGTSYDSE